MKLTLEIAVIFKEYVNQITDYSVEIGFIEARKMFIDKKNKHCDLIEMYWGKNYCRWW